MVKLISKEIADRAADIQRRLVLLVQPPQRLTDEQRQQKAAAHRQLRAERLKQAGGSFSREDIDRLKAEQRGRCVYCGKSLKRRYHIDHIEPLARGGDNSRYNLQLTCPSCNLKKGAKSPIIFARQLGRLI
jgi:5-methylcytosine-specific restriction endonuclease McrA